MTPLPSSWARAWSDLGLQPPPGLFDQLVRAYEEPQRHYHSLQHLRECLTHFEQARHLAQQPGEVAIALWFHDAIYDVRGKNNERQSADWAIRVLASCPRCQDSCRLIGFTQTEPRGRKEPCNAALLC
ncbi:hypothetical protein OF113_20420 [Ectopseudomonas chengduensis]|nr:hypothetical protein [Pseudomonas chengduensis]UZT77368.1 hypothetical protein OF113_20420 [Pseudomonas chengduensis]